MKMIPVSSRTSPVPVNIGLFSGKGEMIYVDAKYFWREFI